MSIATTATLIVEIIGKDLLSPAVASAESGLSSMTGMSLTAAKGASTAERALGLVGSAATGMGNALNHAKGFLGGLVSGPLGMLGLAAGAFTAAGAIKETIGTANTLAGAIEKLAPLTGDSAEQISGLLAVFNKFGISADTATTRLAFMEKAVGTLTLTTKSAAKFQSEFGVSLLDSSGHVKDANSIIALAVQYWNSSASSSQKATFEAKLFGRGFADMIPILNLGSKGLADAQAKAQALGLTLGATDVTALQQYQSAMRDAGEAIDGLKLQLALGLIPDLTKLAIATTQFVTDHRTDIQAFFRGAIGAAETLGGAIVSVGSAMVGWWNKIPGPLQTLLIEALVGNKVIKTVFGINILGTVEGAVANIGKDLLSKVVGGLFGKTIATPVVNVDGAVVNVAGAGLPVPGGGPSVDNSGGLLGTIKKVAYGLIGTAAVAATADLIINADQGRKDLAAKAAAGDPVAIRTQNELATRGMGGGGTANLSGGPSGAMGSMSAASYPQADWNKALAIWNAIQRTSLAAASMTKDALAHLIKLTADQTAKVTGSIALQKVAIEHSGTMTYAQLVALAHQEHTEHVAHLAKLDGLTIAEEQTKLAIEATTAAVKASGGIISTMIGGRLDELAAKPVSVVVTVKGSATVTAKQNTTAATKAKNTGKTPI